MEGPFAFCKQNDMDVYEMFMGICREKYGDIFEELLKAYL